MDSQHSRRGRPKGTGIDDTRRLREIAAMIADDPDLKPTTAIKNIGITDPSSIRRIRDKFNGEKEALLGEAVEHRRSRVYRQNGDPRISESRVMALDLERDPRISEDMDDELPDLRILATAGSDATPEANQHGPEAGKPTVASEETAPAAASVQQDLLLSMLSAGVRASMTMSHLQLVIATHTFQSPMTRSLLRYQIAFSQAFLGCPGPQPGDPKTG